MRAVRIAVYGLLGAVIAVAGGCAGSNAPSPFATADAGLDGGGTRPDVGVPPTGGGPDGGPDLPGEWGGPCLDDGQCDDTIGCTDDSCDPRRQRCHFRPRDASCDDGVFCNGAEQCVAGVGCRPGDVEACSDNTPCTIDACDEASHECSHTPRDADGDGDPDGHCRDGRDCNEQNPDVSSLHAEVCGNGVDDDCDGEIDEDDCVAPSYDRCATPLEVTASGNYPLSFAAAALDYSATCLAPDTPFRDLVVAIHVPEGDPVDVDVAVTTRSGDAALASVGKCGDASTETACASGVSRPAGVHAARLLLRSVPPGIYPVYVFAPSAASAVLAVDLLPGTTAKPNETCGTPERLEPGKDVVVSLVDAVRDVESACGKSYADRVFDFELDATRDVHVFANAEDAYGDPLVSLRREPCEALSSEVTCRAQGARDLFVRALPKGHYFVSVGASGPSDVRVSLETADPTASPPGDRCDTAPALPLDVPVDVDFDGREDDYHAGCLVGAPDTAYALTLERDSDVLLLGAASRGDTGALALSELACKRDALACASAGTGPIRARRNALPAGEYRVVAESAVGSPMKVSALVRDATPSAVVVLADTCADAFAIPPGGGRLTGNTANATDDGSTGCGQDARPPAPDQFLSLHLGAASRVVLDASGSAYPIVVDVRSGAACPGDEVTNGCSAGFDENQARALVDVELPAGDYWVQLDGFDGSSGAWVLDAFILEK